MLQKALCNVDRVTSVCDKWFKGKFMKLYSFKKFNSDPISETSRNTEYDAYTYNTSLSVAQLWCNQRQNKRTAPNNSTCTNIDSRSLIFHTVISYKTSL
jgi:hypothetical protein